MGKLTLFAIISAMALSPWEVRAIQSTADDAIKSAAFKIIRSRVPLEKFKPATENDVSILRHEKNGIIDFIFTSKDGSYVGDAFCQYSELLKYSDKYTDPGHACFRINVSEHIKDPDSINGFGKQVGIY